jgi:hypothetical protein
MFLNFSRQPAFLDEVLNLLATDDYRSVRENLLETSFHQEGSLWYWLYHLQQLPDLYSGLLMHIFETMSQKGCHQYDSLPQILYVMQQPNQNETTIGYSKSFMLERLSQQALLNHWDAYWQTALQIVHFDINWELLETNHSCLISLLDEKNAKAFLTLISLAANDDGFFASWNRLSQNINPACFKKLCHTFKRIDPGHRIHDFISPGLRATHQFFSQDLSEALGSIYSSKRL